MEHPLLYEINTRCWLHELSVARDRRVTLATVPEEEFAAWSRLGFTHIWLMGVWTTGPRARAIALHEPGLRRCYDELLPHWRGTDVGGSPYSIADYSVPTALGGELGLKAFRERLHHHGMKLVLDFVPNHLGIDHTWVAQRPELFVQSPAKADGTFAQETASGVKWIANGKDPYFAAWTDVAQLEYRNPATRDAMRELLLSVAARCDGVRCDMAMLLLNEVFAKTWAHLPFAGPAPATEFWADAIPRVKQANPDFIFMAEVYWGLESRLQSQGFDYTYDKQLYDDLHWRNTGWVQKRLLDAPSGYLAASVHFLENHDEPRAAATLSPTEHRAAALLILGLPGMRFLHEGQLTGAKVKVPVQLIRRPMETPQSEVQAMYEKLLLTLKTTAVGGGEGHLLTPRAAWRDNPTSSSFVVVQWQARGPEFDLVVVNLAPYRSQCYVPLTVAGVTEHDWRMRDLLGDEVYERVGSDMAYSGVYFDLPEHGAQLFRFEPIR
jgi:glycosidase